jgi:hypothetical protein
VQVSLSRGAVRAAIVFRCASFDDHNRALAILGDAECVTTERNCCADGAFG